VTRPSLLTPLITSFLAAPPHQARRDGQAQAGRHPEDQDPRRVTDGTAAAQAAQATAGADALAEALHAARAAQQAAETAAAQAAAALRDAREQAAAAQAAAREQAAATEGASALCAGDGLTGRDPVTAPPVRRIRRSRNSRAQSHSAIRLPSRHPGCCMITLVTGQYCLRWRDATCANAAAAARSGSRLSGNYGHAAGTGRPRGAARAPAGPPHR